MGPSLIFDKSTLQSLSLDEAVWLDHFFRASITPLFFIETLADLEKQVHDGRTPEEVVGHLAHKTPDMNSTPAMHHSKLLDVELSGTDKIVMDGRPILLGGKSVNLNGSRGIIISRTQEEDAFLRWQEGDFLNLERQVAKFWRRSLCKFDHSAAYSFFQRFFPNGKKPSDLGAVKALADSYVDASNREQSLKIGLDLLGYSPYTISYVTDRWKKAGKPELREFAPYFCHIYSVDLFFYLAMSADLISRDRPAGKADNKVDIAYLYYLPFCHIFTSSDKLHARVVPHFLRSDQTFIPGHELKAELRRLDDRYFLVAEDLKARGLTAFAPNPPTEDTFLVTRMWDLYLPKWRTTGAPVDLPDHLQEALRKLVDRVQTESRAADVGEQYTIADANFLQIQRRIKGVKGKWRRVPLDVETQ